MSRRSTAAHSGSCRRRLTRRRAAGLLGLSFVVLVLHGTYSARHPVIQRVSIVLPRLPEAASGLRVVVMADTHLGRYQDRRFVERAVALANSAEPDLVLLVGDYGRRPGSMSQEGRDEAIMPFAYLRARLGVFAVPGNHDHWAGIDGCVRAFQRAGIPLLRNEHHVIDIPGGKLAIVGYDDLSSASTPVDRCYEELSPDLPRITLAHNPESFFRQQQRDLGLMVSGHTHGGQLIIPGIGPLHTPCRIPLRAGAGYTARGANQLYVTRGVGTAIVPLRVNCPSEVTLITLSPGE